jgi:hypothetical protein
MALKGSNSGASMHMVKKAGWESKERKKRKREDAEIAALASEVKTYRLTPEQVQQLLAKDTGGSTFPPDLETIEGE